VGDWYLDIEDIEDMHGEFTLSMNVASIILYQTQ
jgi:hypothetical protein